MYSKLFSKFSYSKYFQFFGNFMIDFNSITVKKYNIVCVYSNKIGNNNKGIKDLAWKKKNITRTRKWKEEDEEAGYDTNKEEANSLKVIVTLHT